MNITSVYNIRLSYIFMYEKYIKYIWKTCIYTKVQIAY